MFKSVLAVVLLSFLGLASFHPASAQAAYDTRSLFRAGGGIKVAPTALPPAPLRTPPAGMAGGSYGGAGSLGATGSRGNMTYKTGEGPYAAINPQYSNRTNNQRTGTLYVVSTACLAPPIGVDATDGGAVTGGTDIANLGALGASLGQALGGNLGQAVGGAIGNGLQNQINQGGPAVEPMTQMENDTSTLATGSGF